MNIKLRKLLEAAGDTLSAPQRNIGSLFSGDGLVDPYSDEADNYDPSKLLVKGPGKLTGVGGLAADMLLDPLNLVGVGALGKIGAKTGIKAAETAARQNAKQAIAQVSPPQSSVSSAAIGKQMKYQVAGDRRRAQRSSDWNAVKAKLDADTPWSRMQSKNKAAYQGRTIPELRSLLLSSQTKSDLPPDVQEFFNINTNNARMNIAVDKPNTYIETVESFPDQPPHIASAIKQPSRKRINKANSLLYGKRSTPEYQQQPAYYDLDSTEAKVQDFFSDEIRDSLLREHQYRTAPINWLERAHTSSPRIKQSRFKGRPGTSYEQDYHNVVGQEAWPGFWANNYRQNFMRNEFIDNDNDTVARVMMKANPYSSRHSKMVFDLRNRLNDKTVREQLRSQLLGRPPLQSER